jgi:predicted alpha/beta hydrolase family esterase
LLSATDYLRENNAAPQLLIGHSLGGAAVLSIASEISELKGVISIAAPAHVEHVIHNFDNQLEEINNKGVAKVKLGVREFSIKKQFIEDVAEHRQKGFNLKGKTSKEFCVLR